jgi:hypothetical protein
MRTHDRALAAIVDHSAKNGDEDGAFALGVKLCNLRAAAKWGIEHYQRRMQGEGIDAVYRGVTLPQGARSINEVMKRFEREQRRDDLERRHAQLAKVYPTLYGSAAEGEAAVGGQDGGAQDVAAEGKGNIFKKEFGHCPGPPGRLSALSVSLCKPFFYGASVWCAGRLAAKNGGFRPGQCRTRRRSGSARTASGWARPSACSRSATVWARPGRFSALGALHSQSALRGVFVWARWVLNRPKWRFPARAVKADECKALQWAESARRQLAQLYMLPIMDKMAAADPLLRKVMAMMQVRTEPLELFEPSKAD